MKQALLAIGCLFMLTAAVASAIGNGSASDRSRDLSDARAFDGYRLYWVGPNDSLALEEILKIPYRDRVWWAFLYGTCDPEGGSCSPPLQIHNWSACSRYLALYPGHQHAAPFRGAKAVWNRFAEGFEVYTGRTTVVVFAANRQAARAAAKDLRPIKRTGPVEALPPPAPGSLGGHLACQRAD